MALEGHFIAVNERQVRYYEAGDSKPRSMLLLHGELGDARLNWESLITHLAETYHVVAPDLPGFGKSDPMPEATLAALVEWVHQFLADLGITQAIVVGASSGALLARLFAANHAQQVTSLVLINGGYLPGKAGFLATLPVIGPYLFNQAAQSQLSTANLSDMIGAKAMLTDEFIERMQAQRAGLLATMQLLAFSPLPKKTIPLAQTLVVWGKDDPIAPVALGKKLPTILPEANFAEIAGCRHMPQIEEPEVLAWQIDNYLSPPKSK